MPRAIPRLAITPDALPAAVRELVRVLGEADAMRLIGLMPGARMAVPKRDRLRLREEEMHPLRMALSAEGFDKLIAEYGGGELHVPKGDAYLRRLRHELVRQCREQGLTFDETADATGYSRRQAMNIMGGATGAADVADMKTRDMFKELDDEKPTTQVAAPAAPASLPGSAANPFGLTKTR